MNRHQRKLSKQASLSALGAFLRAGKVAAAVTGVPLADVVGNAGPGTMRRAPVRFARSAAIYLAVTALDVRQMRLARAIGRPRIRIVKACHHIEDARDRPEIDALLDRMERMIR